MMAPPTQSRVCPGAQRAASGAEAGPGSRWAPGRTVIIQATVTTVTSVSTPMPK